MSSTKGMLLKLYRKSKEYFVIARKANINLSRERRLMLRYIKPGSTVLDVGCGTSENIVLAKDNSCDYIGLDVSPIGLKMSKDYVYSKRHLLLADAEHLPFRNDSISNVISTYALEHLTSPKKCIDEMIRSLSPKGVLLLISPAYDCSLLFAHPAMIRLNFRKKMKILVRKMIATIKLALNISALYNPLILDTLPNFSEKEFVPDADVVNIVLAEQVYGYLQKRLNVIYVNMNTNFKKVPVLRFFSCNLYIVAQKAKTY